MTVIVKAKIINSGLGATEPFKLSDSFQAKDREEAIEIFIKDLESFQTLESIIYVKGYFNGEWRTI